jgi:hypothetical protein
MARRRPNAIAFDENEKRVGVAVARAKPNRHGSFFVRPDAARAGCADGRVY